MATTESEQFAALLRELKDRSGRSYGVLAGRLHMSTSTLHRYCNGDAVPTEYAPVDRLARLCGASPEESVELHRRWILADEARRRARGAGQGASAGPGASAGATDLDTDRTAPRNTDPAVGSAEPPAPGPAEPPAPGPNESAAPGPNESAAPGPAVEPAPAPIEPPALDPAELPAVGPAERPTGRPPAPRSRLARLVPVRPLGRRTRLVLIGAAVVAVAVPVTAVAALSGGPARSDTVADTAARTNPVTGSARPPMSAGPSAVPSRSPSPSGSPSASSSSSSGAPGPKVQPKHSAASGTPVSVGISSYDWDTPCGKYYLLDQKPTAVPPPPPNVQDRRSWARALGGVDGGDLKLELTTTGKGDDAVVITGIGVRVVGREAPLDWTAYSMGSGCGGGVVPQSFDIDLDAPQPVSKPIAGHQGDDVVPAKDFPFKVSTSDPEVFDLNVHTEGHDVSWYLEVGWSSGERSGRVTVNDGGKPFHTAAIKGRPSYDYNTDSNAWEKLDVQ
ncbi:helix-turn-helix transcriptional regulator [Streptomyces sp. NPDC048361]|uniref:helix-turn-helix domain-containing protein n=1 Tax=Streptomyces sp. NPDC048361 TaxID=3154720 RepID=UPI00344560E7